MQSKHSPLGASSSASFSRRGIISAAGAVAASAAVSMPSALAADHPDAKLIELGQQLDPIVRRIESGREKIKKIHSQGYDERFDALRAEWRRRCEAGNPDDTDWMSRIDDLQREYGMDVLLSAADDNYDALDPILNAIIEIPAVTVAGLAVKARATAAVTRGSERWDDDDPDLDVLHLRSLIQAVLSLAETGGRL
jgi:hypothetical protein